MQILKYKDLVNSIESDKISFYNLYNLDIDLVEHKTVSYYLENKHDNIEDENSAQKVSRIFTDIETMPDDYLKGDYEFDFIDNGYVSCLTFYFDQEKKYYCYYLVKQEYLIEKWNYNKDELEKEFIDYLNGNNDDNSVYIDPDDKLEVFIFTNEVKMLVTYWETIKKLQPFWLTGFKSSTFDYPYLYRRLVKLIGEEQTNQIVSIFGNTELKNPNSIQSLKELKKKWTREGKRESSKQIIKIPEYLILDLDTLYIPRGEVGRSGLGYGKTQPRYTLDFLSQEELGIGKIQYKNDKKYEKYSGGRKIFEFYRNEPKRFFLYNIVDVANTVQFDKKLRHFELHNTIRRKMRTPHSTIHGNSAFYSSFLYSEYKDTGHQYIRSLIVEEKGKTLEIDDFHNIPNPVDYKVKKKGKIIYYPFDIKFNTYLSTMSKYIGGYVKNVGYILNNKSTTLAFDATALYPSMMMQFNISLDVYTGRIINPIIYNLIEYFGKIMNEGYSDKLFNNLAASIWDNMIVPAVEKSKFLIGIESTNSDGESTNSKKEHETKIMIYYMLMFLLKKLFNSGMKFENVLNPRNNNEQIMLNYYLNHVIDLIQLIHKNYRGLNEYVHNREYNDKLNNYENYYVLENPTNSNKRIKKLNKEELEKYLNDYIITVTGDLFYKHEDKLGMSFQLIENWKKIRYELEKNGKMLEGKSIKVIMNSYYGYQAVMNAIFRDIYLGKCVAMSAQKAIRNAQLSSNQYLTLKYS